MVFSGIQFLPKSFTKINVFEREFTKEDYPTVVGDSLDQTFKFRRRLSDLGYDVRFDSFPASIEHIKILGDFIEIKEVNGISNISEILRSQR